MLLIRTAGLVIVKQPFPLVLSKNKQLLEEQLQVQLLTASVTQITSVSKVSCNVVSDIKQAATKMMEHDSQQIGEQKISFFLFLFLRYFLFWLADISTRLAKFPLKFLQGTKKAAVFLRFAMQVGYAGLSNVSTIESNLSAPFVVITNECQWEGSAGTLFKKEAFPQGQV